MTKMTKQDAIDVLIAYACCQEGWLSCDMCPALDIEDCVAWTIMHVVEAVKTLRDGKDINVKESDGG